MGSTSGRPRLNIDPPSSRPPVSMATKAANAAAAEKGESSGPSDKWSSVFGKSGKGGLSNDAREAGNGQNSFGDAPRFGGGYGGRSNDHNAADSDPRFAGKFGAGSGPKEIVRDSAPLPTVGPTPAQIAAEKAAKEAEKASKKAAREEAERKVAADKAAAKAAKDAEAAAAAAKAEEALALAKTIVSSGKKGMQLEEHVRGLATKPTAAALLTEVFTQLSTAEVQGLKWCLPAQYGAALRALVKGSKDQLAVIYSCQRYCHANKFPKIAGKSQTTPLIMLMFQVLYKNEICNEEGFAAWQDDDSNVPGRTDATVQTTAFMAVLFEAEEIEVIDEDDVPEGEEIDAPRETC